MSWSNYPADAGPSQALSGVDPGGRQRQFLALDALVHGELLFQGVAHGFACLLIAPNRLPLQML